MRWRQVVVLWIVFALLGVEYWVVERPPPPAPVAPARQRFLSIDPASVRELRLARGGRVIVSRRDAEGWTVVEPAGGAIPPDLVAAFTGALTTAEEIARIGGPEVKPEDFGLDERAARIEVRGDGTSVVVDIGDPNPNGTAVYARHAGAPDVVLIGRQVRDYEDMLFRAVAAGRPEPQTDQAAPVGG